MTGTPVRVGYLGPPGTFSHQALLSAELPESTEHVPLPSIYDTVMAVHEGLVDRSLVPIENALEGSVDVTLDALAADAADVEIVGELVQEIRNCLIAPRALELSQIEAVRSHPQPNAQCASFLRLRLPQAQVLTSSSTAAAVRDVLADPGAPHAALGNRLAAELYGGLVLLDGVDDQEGNETRFVWLARRRSGAPLCAQAPADPPPHAGGSASGALPQMKTSLLFWGAGDEHAGWLVGCLNEFAARGINLTRIESRPRRLGLGHYMFFADLAGGIGESSVAGAVAALSGHCEQVRVLGSYAQATLARR